MKPKPAISKSTIPYSLLLGFSVFSLSMFGILSRDGVDLATFWAGNAFMLGMLIRFPVFASPLTWVACAFGFWFADAVTGSEIVKNLVLNGGNLAAIGTGYVILSRFSQGFKRLEEPLAVVWLFGAIFVASTSSGIVGSFADPFLFNGTHTNGFFFWFVTELVNFSVFLPLILTLPQSNLISVKKLKERSGTATTMRYLPLVSLGLSCIIAVLVGGPGALAFPVPALLWCALSYSIFTTSLLSFAYAVFFLVALRLGFLDIGGNLESRNILLSARVAVTLVALGPLVVGSVMASRADALERLRIIADADSLTGLLNRRAFLRDSETQIQVAMHSGVPVAVLMLDIDHFKTINDMHGHAVGDVVLKEVSEILREKITDYGHVGRLGGEEFAALIIDFDIEGAVKAANAIKHAVSENRISFEGYPPISVTLSVGVSSGRSGEDISMLLNQADKALYESKQMGRNLVVAHSGQI